MIPDIYLYNPTCDFANANGSPNWHPNQLLLTMERDLETLPVYLASTGDFIIVSQPPDDEFITRLRKLEIRNLNFHVKSELSTFTGKINRLQPWGWSPATHKFLQPLKGNCSDEFRLSPVFNWELSKKELYSRKTAANLLTRLISEFPQSFIIDETQIPVVCFTQHEVEDCLEKWGKIIIKAPWSSSGRGLQPITKTPVHIAVWQRVRGLIKDQGYVMAEPFLDKVADLAFEYSIRNRNVCFEGMSYFQTDKKGQYQGNYLNSLSFGVEKDVSVFISNNIGWIADQLRLQIEKSNLPDSYEGFLGIDSLIFRSSDNMLKIHPCLEINLRFTMGILALRLEKLISPDKKGMLRLFFQPDKGFKEFSEEMAAKYPPLFSDGKLNSGYFPLTAFRDNTKFGAYLILV